jgi:Ribbon-helix-helix protein, copG family
MTRRVRAKPISRRNEAELDAMSVEFDREFIADTFGPLTPQAKRRWRHARRKRGRPRVGAGAQPITVTIEKTLLKRVDRIAKRRHTTRAELIARGLHAVLKEESTVGA